VLWAVSTLVLLLYVQQVYLGVWMGYICELESVSILFAGCENSWANTCLFTVYTVRIQLEAMISIDNFLFHGAGDVVGLEGRVVSIRYQQYCNHK
jgi:hypothetical protein